MGQSSSSNDPIVEMRTIPVARILSTSSLKHEDMNFELLYEKKSTSRKFQLKQPITEIVFNIFSQYVDTSSLLAFSRTNSYYYTLCLKAAQQHAHFKFTMTSKPRIFTKDIHWVLNLDCHQNRALNNACLERFSKLTALNISGNVNLTDEGFAPLKGRIKDLNMSGCRYGITDNAFQYLVGIERLDMSLCNQETITDTAFKYLKGIRYLNISRCTQLTITDKAFEYIAGVEELHMANCTQQTITGEALKYLQGIRKLNMSACTNLDGNKFVYLQGIKALNISKCVCPTINDETLKVLQGVEDLNLSGCRQECITNETLKNLKGLRTLDLSLCIQETIDGDGIHHLDGIEALDVSYCRDVVQDAAEKIRVNVLSN